MPLNFAMSLMSATEFVLWAVAAFIFWKKGLHRRFPAMSKYLALRLGSMPILLAVLYVQAQPWAPGQIFRPLYFYGYWIVYGASAVLLFFVCLEVFSSVLASLSGLKTLGTVAFRWVALVSLLISFGTTSFTVGHSSDPLICCAVLAMMRVVGIMGLCLLAFLCLSMNALRSSMRDLTVGLSLGLGLMAADDFVTSSLISHFESLTSPLQFVNEAIILLSLGIWVAYFALPEPVRRPLVMPANSTIYRWNEIAAALGHSTKVAVAQPSAGFFLSDVEKVVDKVLSKNLQSSESKS
ncbi:MAG: hypothetical protein WCA37_04455 [Terracidiphilus sp.]